MQVQTLEYFRNTYGKRHVTVLHRLRTWHNQQMKKDGDITGRHQFTVNELTSRINEAKGK